MNGLLFITHQTERYSALQSAALALDGGCKQIQLRMKDAASSDDIETVAREAKALCDTYGADLYIDDYVDVCRNVGARGVHLGKNDMPPDDARTMLGNSFIIGGTANTFDDICRLSAAGVDYIGLGPFRFTTTKQNLSPILGLTGYQEIVCRCKEAAINLPIIAIGGITATDIPALMKAGASGVALSSTILNAPDPIETTKHIIQIINTV